jgi:protein ImuB
MQRRFVSIWLPHLATDWFAARQPNLKNTAFVLKAASHGRIIVTAASLQAQTQGISTGMALADARAIFPSLQVFDDKPNLATQLLKRIAEWAIRFTPAAAPDQSEGILLDATGCTHLWGGDEAYITDITKRLATRGYTARVAIAGTIGSAWAVARYGRRPLVIESGYEWKALSKLPPSALRLEGETVERLHKLGLRTIESFMEMPRKELRRRFGPQIIQRIAQALGEEEETFTPIFPVQPYEERLPCLEPIVTRTGIEIALERLLKTLCSRLRSESKGLRTAYFRCYRMDNTAQGIEIETSRPSHHEEHLFHLFSLKLSTLEPKRGIELFALEATKVEDCSPLKESLWNINGGSFENERLAELIDRIAVKLGKETIQRYLPAEHHLPERSYGQASLQEQRSIEWRTDKARPLIVLPHPELIDVTAPIPDYPPMNFRHKGTLHKVVRADGPERIEQEWWIQEGEHRDYYAVEDEEGARYWLFRLGHYRAEKANQWYLHGFFA